MEPLFEHYPWLLVPIIIVTMETWMAAKRAFKRKRERA